MALLSVKNVCVGYGGFMLLDDISLNIERHERVCLLGRNGSGKTTLMKLINGEMAPDSGTVTRSQGVATARLDQEIPAGISGPVIDIVTSGLAAKGRLLADYHHAGALLAEGRGDDARLLARLDRLGQQLDAENGWEVSRQVDLVIARMGLPAEAEFSALSTGLKRRTLLARALVSGPDILMLDEPTNHLDIDAIAWLENFLAAYDGTVVIVTHDRRLVHKLASRIIEIDRGRLLDWSCDYPTFLKRKQESLDNEETRSRLFDRKLADEEAWLRRGVKARRTRDQGRVNTLLKMRARRRLRQEQPGGVRMILQEGGRSGNLVMAAEDLGYEYPGKPVVRSLSTVILRRDRVGIIGPNGCGKTTLLRLLLGELPPQQGQVRLGSNLQVVYFDQLRDQLDPEKTVFDSVAGGNDTVTLNGRTRHVIAYLQNFLFTPERARTRVKSLSGGERCRLLLARLFTRPANVLVLDEPTNDLDIETLELLEELLLEFEGDAAAGKPRPGVPRQHRDQHPGLQRRREDRGIRGRLRRLAAPEGGRRGPGRGQARGKAPGAAANAGGQDELQGRAGAGVPAGAPGESGSGKKEPSLLAGQPRFLPRRKRRSRRRQLPPAGTGGQAACRLPALGRP